MADRRVTVLNPAGYQEVLQTADRLYVDSVSQLAATEFTDNITAIRADFSEQITLGLDPTLDSHAVSLGYLNSVANGLDLTAAAPIEINNQVISILGATETAIGAVRFATDAEVIAGSAVDAVVKPNQLDFVLDDLTINGSSPITVTENTSNIIDIDITYASNTEDGSVRFATDAEATAGTSETLAINPKQVKAAIDAIPYATNTIPGIVRFATSGEAQEGIVNNVSITPAQVQAKINGYEIADASKTEKGLVMLAEHIEVAAGIEDTKAVTAAGIRYALDQPYYLLDGGTY